MQKPVEYEQTDPRWRDIPYTATGNKSETIGNSGCGPTCAAMVVATLRDSSVKPPSAAAWSVSHGYLSPHDGTYWGFFKPYLAQYKISCTLTDNKYAVLDAIKRGRMVISAMRKSIWTNSGHFVLAYAYRDGKVLINDPNSEASHREFADESTYLAAVCQAWIIEEAWQVEIKNLEIKDLDRKEFVAVAAINYEGNNYVKLRDLEKLAPVSVDYDGKNPTIQANYKK